MAGVGQEVLRSPERRSVLFDEDITSDDFRMRKFKVYPCTRHHQHDWLACPCYHPHEKVRRRDPTLFHYTGIACPSIKQNGCCELGEHCPFAHNVFEYWLHPTRYRTQLCNDGIRCKRKVCFFAHSLEELRVPEERPFVQTDALLSAAAANAALAAGAPPADSPLGVPPLGVAVPGQAHQQLHQQQHEVQEQLTSQHAWQAGQAARKRDEQRKVIEQVAALLERGQLSPAGSAAILQRMLPPEALQTLQVRIAGGKPPPPGRHAGHQSRSDPNRPELLASSLSRAPLGCGRYSFDMSSARPLAPWAATAEAVPAHAALPPVPPRLPRFGGGAAKQDLPAQTRFQLESAAGRLLAEPAGFQSVIAFNAVHATYESERESLDFASWRSNSNSSSGTASLDAVSWR